MKIIKEETINSSTVRITISNSKNTYIILLEENTKNKTDQYLNIIQGKII